MGSPAIKYWREGWKATVRVATDKPIAARKGGASCHILNTIRRRKRAFDDDIYAEDTLARAGEFSILSTPQTIIHIPNGGKTMNTYKKAFLVLTILTAMGGAVSSARANELAGVKVAKAVLDITTGDQKVFLDRMDLIRQTADGLRKKGIKPDFVLVIPGRRPSLPPKPWRAPSSKIKSWTISPRPNPPWTA